MIDMIQRMEAFFEVNGFINDPAVDTLTLLTTMIDKNLASNSLAKYAILYALHDLLGDSEALANFKRETQCEADPKQYSTALSVYSFYRAVLTRDYKIPPRTHIALYEKCVFLEPSTQATLPDTNSLPFPDDAVFMCVDTERSKDGMLYVFVARGGEWEESVLLHIEQPVFDRVGRILFPTGRLV